MHWPLWRVEVTEPSMVPALRSGDWVLVWRGIRPGRPLRIRPGQIVIAQHPSQADLLLVKRAAERQSAGWWLSSDNTGAPAVDSRSFGHVPVPLIRGRVLLRYWRAPRQSATGPRRQQTGRPE